ncbi:hypothetical protein B0H21DRAFT_740322 [Amylocystis lapponica]|nr:hypothetical protein B0H21DRAFT_740322 [Amylocystis lapponica]
MSSSTELYLPPHLPYPIKITARAVEPPATIERGARLLSYSFTRRAPAPDTHTEIRFGTWDSTIEGTIAKWSFRPGETISARRAQEVPAIFIEEPCKHGVQLGGLCCLCGKDMTSYDYTGFSDASRASIQMTHLANGPLVSLEEAQRIEQETAEHLLKTRKLSLIVDLDQTIVHATVDPTGEAWETRQSKKAASTKEEANNSDDTDSDSEDEVNPNWEALKDVKRFRLGPEALGQPRSRGKGKENAMETEGCMYYIKPRPGWQEFLQTMASKYEMHVYTMGTRAYAEEVCATIDPEGKIFGGRLLSRDESGSLTQKSLQRLFPCDQSMVVIIDDRADVWEWSPNLVKVIPYDFFIGIGDINSAFLPKVDPSIPTVPSGPSPENLQEQPAGDPSSPQEEASSDASSQTAASSPASSDTTLSPSDDRGELLTRNTLALEAQVEERPLAKKQEELQEAPTGSGSDAAETAHVCCPKEKAPRKALLKNDDAELVRVRKILEDVHQLFYDAYDFHKAKQKDSKHKPRKQQESVSPPHDVRTIIPRMRMDVLEGVNILFSSVIPLDTRPEATDIWKTAHAFGAKCYTELTSRITHVVAAKRGTVKVDAARRQGGIKVVWLAWFTDSIALWQRQDETPYLLEPETQTQTRAASPPSDPHQISSDPEPDADDWDEERGTPGGRSLALDEVDWDEVNDEVEAAMNESDDDGDDEGDGEGGPSGRSGTRSGNASEDEGSWTDESNSVISSTTSSPKLKRKRLRSLTPSEVGMNGNVDPDVLRSRLAKRKKIAADRSGSSKLKVAISADDLTDERGPDDEVVASRSSPLTGAAHEGGSQVSEEDSDDEGVMDEEDDFLARELEEEWG